MGRTIVVVVPVGDLLGLDVLRLSDFVCASCVFVWVEVVCIKVCGIKVIGEAPAAIDDDGWLSLTDLGL
jgi:hypothetical protein